MLVNLTIQKDGVSIRLQANIRWFVFEYHCVLWKGPSALGGQLGQSDTTGLKKANRGEMSGAFKHKCHPNIKHSELNPILPFTVS